MTPDITGMRYAVLAIVVCLASPAAAWSEAPEAMAAFDLAHTACQTGDLRSLDTSKACRERDRLWRGLRDAGHVLRRDASAPNGYVWTAGGPATAAERLPTFPRRTEYGEARRSLLALGWEPVTMPGAGKCEADDYRCQGRPEMEGCSGVGMARCQFVWRRRDRLIEIGTVGEDTAYVDRVRCRAGC